LSNYTTTINPVFKANLLALRANMQTTEAKLEAKAEKVGLELMGKILNFLFYPDTC
jgi:hypothetical protein